MTEQILFVDACVRPDSRTRELAQTLLDKLGGALTRVQLQETSVEFLDPAGMEKRAQAGQKQDFSDPVFDGAKQFAQADKIVIAAPYWNLMFPAKLLAYLENVAVAGITFRYGPSGKPESLCKAKELYYVTTAGGFVRQQDFGFDYIKAMARNFFGIPLVRRYGAEGLDIRGAQVDRILQKAKTAIFADGEEETIPYPGSYDPGQDGASAFGGITDHPQSRYYVANDFFRMESGGTLHILSGFKTYQQTTEYTCGAASALMVLNWFGRQRYHEKAVADLLETHVTRGSTVENIADLFDLIGWKVDFHAGTDRRFQTVEEAEAAIIDYMDRGIPMMVDWVDWAGHWQVLIGIDTCGTDTPYDDVLIFADPYDVTDHKQDGYYTYPLGRFFGMWREGPCAEKAVPYQQPFVAAWPGEEK